MTAAHPRWALALLEVDVAPHRQPITVEDVDLVGLRALRVIEVDLLRGGGIGAVHYPPSFAGVDPRLTAVWDARQRVGPAVIAPARSTTTVSLVAAVGLAPGARSGSFDHAHIRYREGSQGYVRDTVLGGQLASGRC